MHEYLMIIKITQNEEENRINKLEEVEEEQKQVSVG
jgi:hypothetical protein